MNETTVIIMLVVLGVALVGHYLSQKTLLAKGWLAVDASPQIKRLSINGGVLFVISIVALTTATFPYGLVGILLFIEAAVCLAFAKKLRNK
jgi:hypothetical protein